MISPKDIQTCYRNTFATSEGRIVLGHILEACHFGIALDPHDTVQVAEYNVGLTIARMAGALDALYPQLGIATKEK